MAQSIANSSAYAVTKDGEITGQRSISANTVNVFGIDDYSMTIVPTSTVWTNTANPMKYTIVFTNASGIVADLVTITDTLPLATATTAGLTLIPASIQTEIVPAAGVTINTSTSTAAALTVTATGEVDGAAVLTVTFDTNYVAPTTP